MYRNFKTAKWWGWFLAQQSFVILAFSPGEFVGLRACKQALAQPTSCGQVISLETHDHTTTRYTLIFPHNTERVSAALVLLVGGGGHLDLDEQGCPQALTGNSLVRKLPLFRKEGFVTVLVDAPSDFSGNDGLAGFRLTTKHAEDIGKVIADVRMRTKASSIWLIGTSRGTISAVNVASRLSGISAPDGIVLTSALMAGDSRARKSWVAHSVFDLPLEAIKMPVLVIGHVADKCLRSPASLMNNITKRTNGIREQVVTVKGGAESSDNSASIDACQGRSPHGFIGQEAEVVKGMARFIRGGNY